MHEKGKPSNGCIKFSAENDPESERDEDTERWEEVIFNIELKKSINMIEIKIYLKDVLVFFVV